MITPTACPRAAAARPGVSGCPLLPVARLPGTPSASASDVLDWIVRRSQRTRPTTEPSPDSNRVRSRPSPTAGRRGRPPQADLALRPEDTPAVAPHSRAAFSTSVSKTGWRSNGRAADHLAGFRPWRSAARAPRSARRFRALQFREQADVLDRDHRLIGEGLEELDLARR